MEALWKAAVLGALYAVLFVMILAVGSIRAQTTAMICLAKIEAGDDCNAFEGDTKP
jgi:hypothetical protein